MINYPMMHYKGMLQRIRRCNKIDTAAQLRFVCRKRKLRKNSPSQTEIAFYSVETLEWWYDTPMQRLELPGSNDIFNYRAGSVSVTSFWPHHLTVSRSCTTQNTTRSVWLSWAFSIIIEHDNFQFYFSTFDTINSNNSA